MLIEPAKRTMSVHPTYKIATWNADGLPQHLEEIKIFLINHDIDIMLISESHLTDKHYIQIPKFKVYHTKHPAEGKAHGGTALIIREKIKHHEIEKQEKEYLQATSIAIEEQHGEMILSSVYCPPIKKGKKNY